MKHLYKIVTLLLIITNVSIAESRLKLFTVYSQYNQDQTQENFNGVMLYLHTHAIDNSGIGLMYSYEYIALEHPDTARYSYITPTIFYREFGFHGAVFIGIKSKIKSVTDSSRENKYEPTICGGIMLIYERYFLKPIVRMDITPKSFTLTGGIGF